jgi:hypothetical protein
MYVSQTREYSLEKSINFFAKWAASQTRVPERSETPAQAEQHNKYNNNHSYGCVQSKEFSIITFSVQTSCLVISNWVQTSTFNTSSLVVTNFTMFDTFDTFRRLISRFKHTRETSVTMISLSAGPTSGVTTFTFESSALFSVKSVFLWFFVEAGPALITIIRLLAFFAAIRTFLTCFESCASLD